MLGRAFVVWWVLGCVSAWAAEVCVTIDTTGWTAQQKNWRSATAYRLAFEAGQNLQPTLSGETICFADPTFDVPTIITAQTLLNRMAQQETQNAAEAAQIAIDQQELGTISAQLEPLYDGLPQAQKDGPLGKLLRREVLKRKLGQ